MTHHGLSSNCPLARPISVKATLRPERLEQKAARSIWPAKMHQSHKKSPSIRPNDRPIAWASKWEWCWAASVLRRMPCSGSQLWKTLQLGVSWTEHSDSGGGSKVCAPTLLGRWYDIYIYIYYVYIYNYIYTYWCKTKSLLLSGQSWRSWPSSGKVQTARGTMINSTNVPWQTSAAHHLSKQYVT